MSDEVMGRVDRHQLAVEEALHPTPAPLRFEISMTPAVETRPHQPGGGCGSLEIWFALLGAGRAVTWSVMSSWFLPETHAIWNQEDPELRRTRFFSDESTREHARSLYKPCAGLLATHRLARAGDAGVQDECCWLENRPCAGEGRYLTDDLLDLLLRQGTRGIYLRMLQEYRREFGDEEPAPEAGDHEALIAARLALQSPLPDPAQLQMDLTGSVLQYADPTTPAEYAPPHLVPVGNLADPPDGSRAREIAEALASKEETGQEATNSP